MKPVLAVLLFSALSWANQTTGTPEPPRVTPEPSAVLLLGVGIGCLAVFRRVMK